jgi:hypothetical protein
MQCIELLFWIITRWFQDLHKERTDDEKKDIVADEQKGFLRGIKTALITL